MAILTLIANLLVITPTLMVFRRVISERMVIVNDYDIGVDIDLAFVDGSGIRYKVYN